MAPEDDSAALSAAPPVRSRIDAVGCGPEMLLVVSGELDLMRHDELRAAMSSAVHSNLTVDLTDVSFVDVVTITLLARAAEMRRLAGQRTVIVGCQPQVRRVFWLAQAQYLLAG